MTVGRLQHDAFGAELRGLIRSPKKEERAIAGIIMSELEALDEAKAEKRNHSKEYNLKGTLSSIRGLRLYNGGKSIRLYFTVVDGTIWMLAIDTDKARNHLAEGMERRLLDRLREVEKRAAS